MNKLKRAPKIENPVLIDRVISHLQDALVNNIGWLDHAFGRSQRLVSLRDAKEYYYPAVYIGRNEYINVLPGQGLGNRAFFSVDDPQEIEFMQLRYNVIKSPVSLILWYDLSTIFADNKEYDTEAVKAQVIRVLTNIVMPDATRIELTKMYERAENIYKGYSLKEIDTQYLMYPYAGLRIDATLTYREQCL